VSVAEAETAGRGAGVRGSPDRAGPIGGRRKGPSSYGLQGSAHQSMTTPISRRPLGSLPP
jgi:hypothetical protein